MTEVLTQEIANEYKDKARILPLNGLQDIGNRRKLRIELEGGGPEGYAEMLVHDGREFSLYL